MNESRIMEDQLAERSAAENSSQAQKLNLAKHSANFIAHDEVNVHCSPAKKVFFPL